MNPADFIPHRHPFLLIDKLLTLEAGTSASGVKKWSKDDPIFQGHFPGEPVVPGVLLLEALAQVGAAAVLAQTEYKRRKAFLVKIEEARFLRVVRPEEEVILKTAVRMLKAGFGEGSGEALVGDEIAVKGKIIFKVV